MEINIKLVDNKAVLPTYGSEGAAAMDITAISKEIVDEKDYGYVEYDSGIAIELPLGYGAFLLPRSSISKTGMWLCNSVGLGDPDYRGTLKFRFKWIPDTKQYEIGEKIGQLIILPVPRIEWNLVTELSETIRGDGGFGSTNKENV